MAYVSLGNPIWSCQYRLQGGRRLFYRTAVCGLLAVGVIILFHRFRETPSPLSTTAADVLRGLAWVQVVVLVLGGAGAITKALMRDYTTKMIESYRMSPMTSFTVIFGYLLGATLQVLLLWAAGLVLGLALCTIGHVGTRDWLLGNCYLLVVTLSIWSISVYAGVGSGKPSNVTPLIVVVAIASSFLMGAVSGLSLFIGVYGVGQCQRSMLGITNSASGLGVALAVALLMLAFWSIVAARRYRKPYLPPLSVVGALVLVALCMLILLVGAVAHDDLVPGGGMAEEFWKDAAHIALVITLLSPLFVAHLPAAAAVQMRRRRIMGARPHLRSDSWSPTFATVLGIALVILMIAVLIAADHFGQLWERQPYDLDARAWGGIVVALVLGVWTMAGLVRLSHFTTGRTVLASMLVLALWVLPPLVDHIRVTYTYGAGEVRAEHYSLLLGCSPFFGIIAACGWPGYVLWPGLVVQGVIAMCAHLLGNRAERLLVRKRARMYADESRAASSPHPSPGTTEGE